MSSGTTLRKTDLELLKSVPRDKAARMHAARLVVATYCSPGGVATIGAIAEKTGYSEAMVREILASKEWDELVAQEILRLVSPIISRGTRMIAEIVDDEDESRHARMQAHRLALQTYETVMKLRPQQQSMDADAAFEEFLKSIPIAEAEVRSDLGGTTTQVLDP